MNRTTLLAAFGLFLASVLPAAAQTPEIDLQLEVPATAAPGSTVPVTAVMTLGKGWHVNSHTPLQDWVIPTALALQASAGKLADVTYPKHEVKKFEFSDEDLAVYEGTERFESQLTLPADASGDVEISAVLSYQACNDHQCFRPDKVPAKATLHLGGAAAATTSAAGAGETPTPTTGAPAPDATKAAVPADLGARFGIVGVPTIVFIGKDGVEVPGTRLAGLEKPKEFLMRLDLVAAGGSAEAGTNDVAKLVGEKGLFLAFVFIFLGGLALDLTPCVYPVIPITVGYFAHQAGGEGGSRRRTFGLALLYVLGMALTYSVLGVAAALSGGLFGSALQSPWAMGVVSLILVGLALSMFGLYEIQAPQALLRFAGSRTGAVGALVMGTLVGFVAAPCIGPLVLALFTYVAASQSVVLGFSMFFVLALGLGFPFLILAVTSASLPRAGAWMVAVKHVFGILMLAAAGWFAKSLPGVRNWMDGFWLPAAILVLGGLWLIVLEKEGRDRPVFRGLLALVGVVFLFAGYWFVRPAPKGAELEWQAGTPAALAAASAAGKPAIVDFYADWCIPCKELDKVTFRDAAVAARLRDWARFKVDMTHAENVSTND